MFPGLTTTLSALLESSSLTVDAVSDIDQWATAILDARKHDGMYHICTQWSCIYLPPSHAARKCKEEPQ